MSAVTVKHFLLCLIFALGFSGLALVNGADSAPAVSTAPDQKTRAAIQEVESRLVSAIEKCDLPALTRLLADSYSDSYEGSDRALAKNGVLILAKAGRLANYRMQKDIAFARTDNTVSVEGLSLDQRKDGPETGRLLLIRRVWMLKNGRWFLRSQLRFPSEIGSSESESSYH